MRNYPLLKNKNNAETSHNWQNTYVNSLVMHTKSLIDYSNYFLADYRLGPDFKFLGIYKGWDNQVDSNNIQIYKFITQQNEWLVKITNFTFIAGVHYAVVCHLSQEYNGEMVINSDFINDNQATFDNGRTFKRMDNRNQRVVSFTPTENISTTTEPYDILVQSNESGSHQFYISNVEICKIPSESAHGINCYSLENLRYHQYRNTDEEAYYFLKANDWKEEDRGGDNPPVPTVLGAKKIRAGRHIINNNQKESDLDTYKDWENMVIQPIGYTAFYIMTYDKGRFNFKYTRNAQLYYGTEQPITPAPFDTRFFYRLNDFNIIQQKLPGLDIPAKPYRDADYIDDQPNYSAPWGISDYHGIIWTDQEKPPMGFLYQKKTNNNLLGEEVIADVKIKATVEVARNSSVVYTMTARGKKAGDGKEYLYYSSNSVLRLI